MANNDNHIHCSHLAGLLQFFGPDTGPNFPNCIHKLWISLHLPNLGTVYSPISTVDVGKQSFILLLSLESSLEKYLPMSM